MKAFRWGFVTLVFVYLYLPIALLVINSFNVSKYGHEWRGFSLKWYEKLAGNDALMQAFTNSLVIATLAATAATIIGTLMALAIYRYRFPLRKTASGLLFVVMLSPDIVLAITFLVIFIVEFLVRWYLAVRRQTYPRWFFFPIFNWYDMLSLIPVTALRPLRLLRVVSIYMRLRRSDLSPRGGTDRPRPPGSRRRTDRSRAGRAAAGPGPPGILPVGRGFRSGRRLTGEWTWGWISDLSEPARYL